MTAEDLTKLRELLCQAYEVSPSELEGLFDEPAFRRAAWVDDFAALVPDTGLFRLYVEHTQDVRSPTAFHFFAFAVVMGAALRRQVWFDMGLAGKIYPNMVVCLVGPSGRVGKNTAANLAVSIGERSQRVRILPEKSTPEALGTALAALRGGATGMLYAPELSAFLGKQEYNRDLIKFLTRIWDCPDKLVINTQKRKEEIIENVAVSALFCSVEEWLVEAVPSDAFSTGYMARQLAIYQQDTDRFIYRPPRPDPEREIELIKALVALEVVRGAVELDRAADMWLRDWFHAFHEQPVDPRLTATMERYQDHLLRLAMLLLVAEGGEGLWIRASHLEKADAIMKWVVGKLPALFDLVGTTFVGRDHALILRLIEKAGGRMTRAELTHAMRGRLTARQLDERINTLAQACEIRILRGGLWEHQRGRFVYELRKHGA